ncbi:HAD family hydrolase [Thalassotalea fusca]
MSKAVLFDLDGTLLDTAKDLGAALNHVLAVNHLPEIAYDISRPLASDGAKGLLELGFGSALSRFNYDELRELFLQYYEENIAVHTKLYAGIESMLANIDKAGIPWGIVTNKPEALAQKLVAFYPALNTSQVLLGGDSLPQRKPDPEPLRVACGQLSCETTNTWYIGDALRDMQASNAAGMTSVVANWGYIKLTDDVEQWHADFIINDPHEILQLIN